jgi:hypothetical protein
MPGCPIVARSDGDHLLPGLSTFQASKMRVCGGLVRWSCIMRASGKIAIRRFSIGSALYFGWYNADTQGFPIRNYLRVYLDCYSTVGRFITPADATSRARIETAADGRKHVVGARSGGYDVLIQPDARVYDWKIAYDPRAKGGQKVITLMLGDESTTIECGASPSGRFPVAQ